MLKERFKVNACNIFFKSVLVVHVQFVFINLYKTKKFRLKAVSSVILENNHTVLMEGRGVDSKRNPHLNIVTHV